MKNDYTNVRTGRLVAKEIVYIKGVKKWKCLCDCGNYTYASGTEIKNGTRISCGCINREKKKPPEYKRLKSVYIGMKSRCYNKNNPGFHNYGGRGIIICDEWLNDFNAFYEWAISAGYDINKSRAEQSLDRIDVNGNYEPSNCRWADQKTQNNNTRVNVHYIVDGKDYTQAQLCEKYNIPDSTLRYRLESKTIEEVIYDIENPKELTEKEKAKKDYFKKYREEHKEYFKEYRKKYKKVAY